MMKMRTLLTVLFVSICAVQNAWARTAPTLPETQTLESGKTYYLYNVGSDRFLYRSGNVPEIQQGRATSVFVTQTADKTYMLQFSDNNCYIWTSGGNLNTQTGIDQDVYFRIEPTEGGYIIRRNRNYNESQYVGYNGSTRANSDVGSDGNILWQFISADLKDQVDMYAAKTYLNSALNAAETTNYEVSDYNDIYEDATQTASQIASAADRLYEGISISGKMYMSWSDYPILFAFHNSGWRTYDNEYDSPQIKDGGRATITATVNVDEDATLVYDARNLYSKVYLDDELVAYNNNGQALENGYNHYVEMGPGKHVVKWIFENDNSGNASGYLCNVGIEKTPTITVSLLEPGSLGTEVLKNTDHIQNVRKLVISGPMNSDDWARIMMMTSLFSLDLTDAEITEIPESQLSYYSHRDNLYFFHEVKLPTTLKTIGNNAFHGSDISLTEFPDGLISIGRYAFNHTRLPRAIIPESVTSIGEYAFANNHYLNNVSYPATARNIPENCFNNCQRLQPFQIPEGITTIGYAAFVSCYEFDTAIPTTVTSIGASAFNNSGICNVVIGERVNVDSYAFANCGNLTTAVFPTTMYDEIYSLLSSCGNLRDVTFKSPTMVKSSRKNIFNNNNMSDITLHVPNYLVNTYKQDGYWYNCNVVGFSTADIQDWIVCQPLKMSFGQRFEGTPNVKVQGAGTWEIKGDDVMTLNNFETDFYNNYNGYVENMTSQILSTCDNITITGDYTYCYYTIKNKWYFVTLPFDTKVGDITCPSSFAIRYYDGANRAVNATGGNWKNYAKDNVIPAGTGFIFQTSQDVWTGFKAQDNESKQRVFSNEIITTNLQVNASEQKEHKGWNLVGNPWMCYYNIHKMNFTAPITTWNPYYGTYTAYSIFDDDYAIKPNEAFFVQCPSDELTTIEFPVDGRQLTSVIESQNAARRLGEDPRKLVDIELTNGETTDKTRFVLNPQAKMDYETTCDASKFLSMDNSVPQIYTIENGIQLAINERPAGDGVVTIGVKIPADGTYTIKSERTALKEAVIIDKLNGTETTLSAEGYTFSAHAGTIDNRFELRLSASETTGIKELKDSRIEELKSFYNLNGQRMSAPQKGINVVNGRKFVIK